MVADADGRRARGRERRGRRAPSPRSVAALGATRGSADRRPRAFPRLADLRRGALSRRGLVGRHGSSRPRILILVENLSVPFDRRVWQESRALDEAGTRSGHLPARHQARHRALRVIDGVEIHRYPLEAATGGPAGYLQGVRHGALALASARAAALDGRDLSTSFRRAIRRTCCSSSRCPYAARRALRLRPSRSRARAVRVALRTAGPRCCRSVLERLTFRLADHVISTNESYREVAIERGRLSARARHVVRSAPDLDAFRAGLPTEPACGAASASWPATSV